MPQSRGELKCSEAPQKLHGRLVLCLIFVFLVLRRYVIFKFLFFEFVV